MSKLKSAISLVIILIFFSGCQTVKDKTDAIVEKENEKLSKFLGKSASDCLLYTSPSPRDRG